MALQLRAPDAAEHLQVPPELLAVRARRAPRVRARARIGARRLASAPLQPVEPRRGGLRQAAPRQRGAGVIVASVLQPLEDLLAWALTHLHDNVGLPWAWSIVALTIIVRILLVPLTVRQIHSMQNLQAHMPEMKAIQTKYKGDRQKQNEELMKFYRENQINPASS